MIRPSAIGTRSLIGDVRRNKMWGDKGSWEFVPNNANALYILASIRGAPADRAMESRQ